MRGSRFAIAYELSSMTRTESRPTPSCPDHPHGGLGRMLRRRHARVRGVASVVAALALALAGCGGGGSSSSTRATTPTAAARSSVPATIALSSPAFANGGPIPRRFTCDAQDVTPPLRWSGVPAGTAELALTLEDENARGESGAPFVHWSVFGIPPAATSVPPKAKTGTTDFHETHYGGPCPP